MPHILILCAHRPKRSPSQRYRFEQYLPFLQSHGFDFTWSYLLDAANDQIFYSPANPARKFLILLKNYLQRKKDIRRFKNFDIIFIQREAFFTGTSFVEKAAYESGAKVIFDFDDSIWLEDTSPGNKKYAWLKKPSKFFDNVKFAHTVIAGNQYLAEKAKQWNSNVVVIPTTIDTEIHIPKPELRNKEYVTIGWSGSISTVKHFNLVVPVLKKISLKYGEKVRFKVVGDAHYHNSDLDVNAVAWNEHSEVNELNSFDIGIMPLPDDEWAKGKCGLKGLSYMACGIACVMSPVGVNKEIIQNNINGLLAANDTDWFNGLCRLIEDAGLRKTLGSNGRDTVMKLFSVEANKQKYLEVFNRLTNKKH